MTMKSLTILFEAPFGSVYKEFYDGDRYEV